MRFYSSITYSPTFIRMHIKHWYDVNCDFYSNINLIYIRFDNLFGTDVSILAEYKHYQLFDLFMFAIRIFEHSL